MSDVGHMMLLQTRSIVPLAVADPGDATGMPPASTNGTNSFVSAKKHPCWRLVTPQWEILEPPLLQF